VVGKIQSNRKNNETFTQWRNRNAGWLDSEFSQLEDLVERFKGESRIGLKLLGM